MLTTPSIKDRVIWLHFCVTVKLPLWLFRKLHLFGLLPLPCSVPMLKHKALVFAADPQNPLGSVGDQALYKGLLQLQKDADPTCQSINILCYRQPKHTMAGLNFITVTDSWLGTVIIAACIKQCGSFYLLGADVVDGKYGTKFVCKAMGLLNFSAAIKCPAGITGFSFNSQPRWPIVKALKRLPAEVKLCVRDAASQQRLATFIKRPSTLVADLAFSIQPSQDLSAEAEHWLQQCKKEEGLIVGLNINKHAFYKQLASLGEEGFLKQICQQLSQLAKQYPVSFALIAHDFKTDAGDTALLTQLQTQLEHDTDRPCIFFAEPDPCQVKHLVAKLDFVISARMHLAIASLGVTTPVQVINYQDKFAGLLQHFNLPSSDLFEPEQVLSPHFLEQVGLMCQQHQAVRTHLQQALPKVKRMCRDNLVTTAVASHS
ncbi:polysaccharide pyruvyl transferase family protein [Motilimonas pumila]|uniref:Polysaccharide pyruvyl transferase domain-containing protein n=1 Tax=Motilimonas pumila TaxID=2303987 RepID=A0A418YJ13_9GAMM|nr:polysaccharide pyruvyl transferase family protein [Motilimonas pumila]RJG50641.1 hypothetical protein D1Z90_03985 [Motilimonas pumila]